MPKTINKQLLFAVCAALAAWQGSDFSLDPKDLLAVLTAGIFGFLAPYKNPSNIDSNDGIDQ